MGTMLRPLTVADRSNVEALLTASRAFNEEEVRVALDMVDAGLAGDYDLLAIEAGARLAGYACFGPAPLTLSSWYLYWVCVDRSSQGRGLGRTLQAAVEAAILAKGGARLIVETSGRADYAGARRFYTKAGFRPAGRIIDFYAPNDDCLILYKRLTRADRDDGQ